MTFEITGEHNSATVHTNQSRDNVEDDPIEQIQEMVDHPAFEGDGDVSVMPDFHWGKGCVIGFTMPIKDTVVPNTVGVDIGCGMLAHNFGTLGINTDDQQTLEELDTNIRSRVPMGFNVHSRNDYHIVNDFPWKTCDEKWSSFVEHSDFDFDDTPDYGKEYFLNLCKRVGYDTTRAINSVGTLGGGNHFIELGTDSRDHVWAIIHSGSRGIGAEIAQYWQDEATTYTYQRNNLVTVPEDEIKYFDVAEGLTDKINGGTGSLYTKPESLSINRDAVLEDYDGEAIQGKYGQLKSYLNAGKEDADPLDYLEGQEAYGYIRDMIFAQTYASESRNEMMYAVSESLTELLHKEHTAPIQTIESVHNYIDFEDATVRKGACRAHDGESLVVPMNMSYGTLICEGRGKDNWNNSSAHGAGRAMSRTGAEDRFDADDFAEQTEGVYMSKTPLDELPKAYKDPEMVEAALGESVTVIDRVIPFLSLKAE